MNKPLLALAPWKVCSWTLWISNEISQRVAAPAQLNGDKTNFELIDLLGDRLIEISHGLSESEAFAKPASLRRLIGSYAIEVSFGEPWDDSAFHRKSER